MISYKDAVVSVATALSIFLLSSSVNAILLEKRSDSRCGHLGDSIYCFGGYITDSLYDNQLYILPLKKLSTGNNTMEFIAQSWSLVNHSNSEYVLERRRKATSTTYGNTLFITGGYSYGTSVLDNQTIAYDSDTNTWCTFSNYTTPEGYAQQIYSATAISLAPVENTIALFGGSTENTLLSGGPAPVQIDDKNHTIIHEGFTSMYTFDYNQNLWAKKSPQTNLPTNFYSSQTATFNPRTGLIYYLGGYYFSPSDYTINNAQDYNTANVFSTTSGNWDLVQLQGDAPAARIFPTATLLPNSDHILLFGGSETGDYSAFPDFCYTLDLGTNNWTLQSNTQGGSSALRFAHSAVLVNTSLFIMFGLAVYGKPQNDILVFSVNDVNNIYFTGTFPYTEIVKPATITTNMTDNGTTISAGDISPTVDILSTGAIAGISVSCVIIGLAVSAALLYFFCIRKKKQAKKNMDELTVDWDEVDNFYNNANESHGRNMIENEKYLPIVKPEGKTLHTFSSSTLGKYSERYTPNEYSDDSIPKDSKTLNTNNTSNLAEEQMKLMKPSVINEENDTKYVSSSPKPVAMRLKPDIDVTTILEPDI